MAYKFYGAETADVKDERGLTPRDYYDLLTDLWTIETCAPAFRPEWSEENRTLGQCSITAFLVQDHFGGKVFGLPLPDGATHCFNDVDGCVFDLTSEQFGDEVKDYVHVTEQFREEHFANADKKARYELLKKGLEKKLRS